MNKATLNVPNISCGHCVGTVETELKELKGIVSVSANLETKIVEIDFQDPADLSQIISLLEDINFPVLD